MTENSKTMIQLFTSTAYTYITRNTAGIPTEHKEQVRFQTVALPVLRYLANIIALPEEEMKATDTKKGTLFTMHGGSHPKSITLRLHIKLEREKQGSVKTIIKDEQDSPKK